MERVLQKRHTQFHEVQRFRQWWLWTILFVIQIILLFAIIQSPDISVNNILYGLVIVLIFVPTFLMWGIYGVRLETKLDEHGLSWRWRPFMKKFQTFEWGIIQKAELVEYSVLTGYGLRYSTKYGTVHNIAGNWGIQIILKNGSKYMLGTQMPEEAQLTMNEYIQ